MERWGQGDFLEIDPDSDEQRQNPENRPPESRILEFRPIVPRNVNDGEDGEDDEFDAEDEAAAGDGGIPPSWLAATPPANTPVWAETTDTQVAPPAEPASTAAASAHPNADQTTSKQPRRAGRRTHPLPWEDTEFLGVSGTAAFSNVSIGQGQMPAGTSLATRGEVFQQFSASVPLPLRTGNKVTPRTRAVALALVLLAVLLTCTCAAILLNPALQRNGYPFGLGNIFATQTAYGPSSTPGNVATPTHPGGSAATPTTPRGGGGGPTPTPNPGSATVAFFVSSQQITSNGSMTACASGCTINGQYYKNSQSFTSSQRQSTFIPQTDLSGTIVATNNGSTSWVSSSYSFSGGGFSCQPDSVNLPAGTSNNYPCVINASSPQEIAANTIKGTVSGTKVSFTNPQPLLGNGHWQVTASDCNSAIAATEQSGQQWGTTWVQGQVPSGWQLALNTPVFSYSNKQCPQGQQIQFFTATSTTTVQDGAFVATDAQNAALNRLNASVPAGYVIKQGTIQVCNPSGTGLSGSTINLACSDKATVIYNWTQTMKAALAQQVAGTSKTQATSICNATTGVAPNSCVVTINLGNGSTMPIDTSVIVIQANIP